MHLHGAKFLSPMDSKYSFNSGKLEIPDVFFNDMLQRYERLLAGGSRIWLKLSILHPVGHLPDIN